MRTELEEVSDGVCRIAVPGGWIYVVHANMTNGVTFVPDPDTINKAADRICAAITRDIWHAILNGVPTE